jgi:ATP-binding cassette, subfamily A (ABC1), member 3
LALGLLYSVASMISYIAQEKELRQKELMKMMSVTEWDIESSWFFTFFLLNFVSATLTTLVSSFLFAHSSPFILWLFWMLVFLSITLFCTALAACCSKATRGVLLGLLVYFSGVFLALALDPSTTSLWATNLITLHPVATFFYGVKLLGALEDIQIGATVESLQLEALGVNYDVAHVLLCFVYSSLLWMFLTWYLNRVITPDYGQALPFWFPFTTSYWKSFVSDDGTKDVNSDTTSSSTETSRSDIGDDQTPVEPVSAALRRQTREGKSIEVVNLRKSFGDKTAVNGLNMSMYCGQITALLGHNGAGKTTTINMLTGAMAPTSGTATVAGKDIRTQMQEIRRDVGVCMQHDCLFPKLTVREHVEFFTRLKGVYRELPREEAEKHIDQAIEDVALSEKRHTRSSNLSGGMKRKLSVAIAFCGKSKLVILDEPTSGMVGSTWSFPVTGILSKLFVAADHQHIHFSCTETGSLFQAVYMERHSTLPTGQNHYPNDTFYGRS